MKKKLFSASPIPIIVYLFALFSAISFFVSTSKADIGAINIRISATIVDSTCTVSIDSTNQVVNLGVWASRQFFAGPNAATTPVPFAILLQKCGPAATGVKVNFNGTIDPNDNELFALNDSSTATSVGVAILDRNRQRIAPNSQSISYALTNTADVPLQFYAQYVATNNSIQPGTANTESVFELEYD